MGGWGGLRGAQHDVQTFDPDSALGRLESAGRNLEKAEKEGKLKDPSQAMGQVMGALSGAGAGTTIEALRVETLKSFIPGTLGWPAATEHLGRAQCRDGDAGRRRARPLRR